MPPRPGTKQISKPPQRKSKLSSRGLQLAVDLNSASTASADSDKAYHAIISTTARATADSTTIASSPPFHGLTTSGSVPVPQSQAHTAQEGQCSGASLHSASSTCTLLSPSHTNEASPSFTHAQGHPAIALAEPAPVFHTPCEGQNMGTINQTMSDQDGDVGMQRLDGGMPTPTPDMAPVAPPLHTAMFEAIDLMKTRIRQLEEGNVSATPTERARYGMLLGACHNMDPVFLILHQQYCCWMIDRRTAYARFPIQPTVIDVAFGELYNLFQDGERLSPPHRLWCSRYPGFSDDVVGLDRVYSQIKDFITVFAIKWPHALAAIQSKKVPLMAFQIRDWFLCTSPTIANTLFTYIRRVIGVPNGPLGVEINHLFNMDNCQERAFEEQKVSPEEMAGIRSTMLRSYLAVVQKARIQQASLAVVPAANSQRVPGHVPASASAMNINNDNNNNNTNTDAGADANANTNTNTIGNHNYDTNNNAPRVTSRASHQPQLTRPLLQDLAHQTQAPMVRPQPHQALPHASSQASQASPQNAQPAALPARPPSQPAASSEGRLRPCGLQDPTGSPDFPRNLQATRVPGPPGPPALDQENFLPPMILPRGESLPPAERRPRQHQSHDTSHPSPSLPSPPQPQQSPPPLYPQHPSLPPRPLVSTHPSPPLPPPSLPPPPRPYTPRTQHPSPPPQPQEPSRPQYSSPASLLQRYPSPQLPQDAQHPQIHHQNQQRPPYPQRVQYPQYPQHPQYSQHSRQPQLPQHMQLQYLRQSQSHQQFMNPQHPQHLQYLQYVRNAQQQQLRNAQQHPTQHQQHPTQHQQHPTQHQQHPTQHQQHPTQHQQQTQQQQNHGTHGNESHLRGPNPHAMQNPAFTPLQQNHSLPPSGQTQQHGVQGDSRQHHQPSPMLSNGPPPLLSYPHHQNTPPTPTLQTSQVSQALQSSGGPQGRQGQGHVHSSPQLTMVRQPYRRSGMPVQVLQDPGLHYVQAQPHTRDPHLALPSHPGPTSSRSIPHFTTYPLPPYEHPCSPHHITSLEASLHLTGLRSPRRISSGPGQGAQKRLTRYYQFVSRFAVEPSEVPPQMGVAVFEFDVTQEETDRLSITSRPPASPLDDLYMTQLPVSRHFNHSLRYRLRMCFTRKNEGLAALDIASWSRRATYWPPHIFVSVNEKILHVRRKQHFHHDLPLELTDSLSRGKNKIKVSLPLFPGNLIQDIAYFMAVERIVTLDHDTVWDMVTSGPHVTVEVAKKEICRRLKGLDTDEIIIESDAIAVSVTDLYSSTLNKMPVRGRKCLHLECFDLGTWLLSRPSKPPQGLGEPTMVDCWACPICGMDARPCNLQVDDFFADVAKELLASGNTGVKKIEVLADGSWTAIEEVNEGEELSGSEGAQQSPPSRVKIQEETPDTLD